MNRKILALLAFIVMILSACGVQDEGSNQTLGKKPPKPEIMVNGGSITVYQSSYCWIQECADYPRPDDMLREKEKEAVAANATIEYFFDGKQPTEISISKFHNETISDVPTVGNSFQAPSEEGVYYYGLSATWLKDQDKRISEGSSAYAFAIEVVGN